MICHIFFSDYRIDGIENTQIKHLKCNKFIAKNERLENCSPDVLCGTSLAIL